MGGLGKLESSSLDTLNDKLNKHLSGDGSCFREDTRLDNLPTFLLGLFSYNCRHNKSGMSQKFPITVHEQTICAKQSQYAWCFLEAFYLLKQKYNSSTHLYKCLSRVIGKNFVETPVQKYFLYLLSISCWIWVMPDSPKNSVCWRYLISCKR